MMSATRPVAVRNVPMVLLFDMKKHQERDIKIARPVLKVTVDHVAFTIHKSLRRVLLIISYFRFIIRTFSLKHAVVISSNLYRFKEGFLFAVFVF